MAEELGSGTKRIFKYTPLYANGQLPEIYEDDYFAIVIPTPFAVADTNSGTINHGCDTINCANDTINDTINGGSDTINGKDVTISPEDVTINSGKNSMTPIEVIVHLLRTHPYITGIELAEYLGVSRRNIVRCLNKLQADGRIIRVGAKKNGHWEVLERCLSHD